MGWTTEEKHFHSGKRPQFFSSSVCPEPFWEPHILFSRFQGVKWHEHEADLSLAAGTQISCPPYNFTTLRGTAFSDICDILSVYCAGQIVSPCLWTFILPLWQVFVTRSGIDKWQKLILKCCLDHFCHYLIISGDFWFLSSSMAFIFFIIFFNIPLHDRVIRYKIRHS